MVVSNDARASSWRERLRRYGSSSLTVAEFCRREGVSVANFYYRRRRPADASSAIPSEIPSEKPSSARSLKAAPAFQPLLLAGGGRVTVELGGGVRIELPAEQELVRAVAAELLAGVRAPGDA